MPTERFYRLPKEKTEAIRSAAAREFMRVPPDEASINRIIRDAEISRGSFYTYFKDKNDVLMWLMGGAVKQHLRFYVTELQKNGGEIWDVLNRVLDSCILISEKDGIVEIIGNLTKSSAFSELLRAHMDDDEKFCKSNATYVNWLYEHMDKTRCPLDRAAFYDLMEMHMLVMMMSMKTFFRDQKSKEEVREYYLRHMRILRYGICVAEGQASRECPAGEPAEQARQECPAGQRPGSMDED